MRLLRLRLRRITQGEKKETRNAGDEYSVHRALSWCSKRRKAGPCSTSIYIAWIVAEFRSRLITKGVELDAGIRCLVSELGAWHLLVPELGAWHLLELGMAHPVFLGGKQNRSAIT